MIKNFDLLKQQLNELSPIINSFKSETVQLRLVELVFAQAGETSESGVDTDDLEKVPTKRRAKNKRGKTGTAKKPSSLRVEQKSKRGKSGRPGPGAIVEQLITEKFFKTGKSPNDVVIHCRNNKVLTYNGTEISVALGRAVKNKKLMREKDENGQFLYVER